MICDDREEDEREEKRVKECRREVERSREEMKLYADKRKKQGKGREKERMSGKKN